MTISRRSLLAGSAALSLAAASYGRILAQSSAIPLAVDLDWLAARSTKPGLRLFDVSPLHVWRNGHIDSAEHAWWRDTVDPNYPVFGAVLTQGDDQSHRQQMLDSLKLGIDDNVVVYDNEHGFRAARLVWFLHFLGFEHAALLRAGYDDWNAAPVPIASASSASSSPAVDPQNGFYLVTEQLLGRLDRPDVQIVDIRTDHERANDLGGAMPTGQIPGSIRFPWDTMLGVGGWLAEPDAIISKATNAGLDPNLKTVLYGNFGVDTALSWLALSAADFEHVLTYDRGWAEWSTTPDLPRAPLA